jgi:hypothetical protein
LNAVAVLKRNEGSMRRALCAALFFLVGFNPALGEVRIEASTGGEVSHYLELFAVLRQSGERIVIDGPCYSACTLVLSTIPHNRVCVTRRAILGFHAPRLVDDYGREYLAPEATREVVAAYPAPIRNWISRHGGLRQRPIFLRGRELMALYPLCR